MAIDPSKINWQPIIDLLGKAGTETSEYQKASAAGLTGKIAFWVGLVGLIATAVAGALGSDSKIGAAAALVVTVTGAVVQLLSSNSYSAARQDTKAQAAAVVAAAVTAPVASPAVVVATSTNPPAV